MKYCFSKILICFLLAIKIAIVSVSAQELSIETSFKAGNGLFPEMQPADLPPVIRRELGIEKSTGTIQYPQTIVSFMNLPIDDTIGIANAYYEFYEGVKEKRDDAGFMVVAFKNEKAVYQATSILRSQSNEVMLRVGLYLIMIWSDEPGDRQKSTLNRLASYFQNTVKATVINQTETSDNRSEVHNEIPGNPTVQTPIATDEIPSGTKYDKDAEFPGGMNAMRMYVSNNLQFPDELIGTDIEGKVIVEFLIDKSGNISDITIKSSPHQAFSDEVRRIFRKMPRWSPALINGKPAAFKFRLPVYFKNIESE